MSLVGRFFRSEFHGRLDKEMRRVDAWLRERAIPVSVGTPGWWLCVLHEPPQRWVGRFKKSYNGVYNPRRWGGYILGLEIGSRG